MAVVARIATIALTSGTGSRTFVASAAAQDTAAGASVTVTVTNTASGTAPPAVPDTFTLRYRRSDETVIRSVTLNASAASQTDSFTFTDTGVSGGANRSGTIIIDMQATKTTGGPTAVYDVETDGSPNTPPATFTTSQLDRGWIRGTTVATLKVSKDGGAGAATPLLAYPDTITGRLTPAAPLFQARTLTVTLGPVSAVTAASTTDLDAAMGTADNRFPAVATTYTPAITVPNDALTGVPFVAFTMVTSTNAAVDPRITRRPLFQIDDNTFGTPPMSKDILSHQRQVSQQGFLASRSTNARGEGVNGLTYNVSLTPDKPGTPISQTGLVTVTQGGEAGWAPNFLSWSSSLPNGTWRKSATITAPANIVGTSYVVQSGSLEYTLVAPQNYAVRVNVNHDASQAFRHFEAGMAFCVVAYLLDLTTQKRVASTLVSSARVSITRANPSDVNGLSNTYQFLNSDSVDDGTEWTTWLGDGVQTIFALVSSSADDRVYEKRFTNTAKWGGRDFRANVQIVSEGVVYAGDLVVPNLGGSNSHTGYAVDPFAAASGILATR